MAAEGWGKPLVGHCALACAAAMAMFAPASALAADEGPMAATFLPPQDPVVTCRKELADNPAERDAGHRVMAVPREEAQLAARSDVKPIDAHGRAAAPSETVTVEVLVGPCGVVDSAAMTKGNPVYARDAVAQARTWLFQPLNGLGGRWRFTEQIPVLPGTAFRNGVVVFPTPDRRDWVIRLTREACYGLCPIYSV